MVNIYNVYLHTIWYHVTVLFWFGQLFMHALCLQEREIAPLWTLTCMAATEKHEHVI